MCDESSMCAGGPRSKAYLALPLLLLVHWSMTAALALPIWLLWSVCGLGARYFSFLPVAWQIIPLPHLAGLFVLAGIVRMALMPFTAELRA